jgi:hypothetical protein
MSNRSIPELAGLHQQFAGRGVAWFGVVSGKTASRDRARQYREEYRLPFPVLVDSGRTLARATGATVTPEAAVLDGKGALVYRGRINDLYVDYGKTRRAPTQHDLRDALESALRGEPVRTPRTRVFGCAIPK